MDSSPWIKSARCSEPFLKWNDCGFCSYPSNLENKAAGSEENHLGKSTNILVLHFLSTKHAIFLSIIVGGLATPVTNYCIVAIDTVQAMLDGWKVVRKYRQCPSDAEGILKVKQLYYAYMYM